ncbi:cilia- and flagella-associated protein 251-like [Hippocampus zosterae]|uniref:cilia- and flagella-associated protein 251-like n=1 Tax=Hippocampus zosterae TaxID=109293 RepID=UPI00223E6467|nr:cilia- and flagella-associated protein 251-like [Hippocampus zosterae]
MTRRRKILNWLLTAELHRANVDPAEWRDSWRTRERGNPAEEDNAAEVSELLTDTEEEDEGVRDDEGSEDDKEEDEGVDEEEEEEAEDAQLEDNREDVKPKMETPNRELVEIEPEEDDPEDEDEEKQESDEDDQELEEDVETRETKLLNNHMDLRNRDEDEDGDSGVTDDEKEERGNAVREAREYENVSLQLKEIFRMMTNKREKDQEETDEDKDRAAAKRWPGGTDREDGDQAAYLQEEEEGQAQGGEDQIEEEEEEEENRWGGGGVEDDLEEKDLTRHIEEGSLGQDQRAEEVAALNKEDDANREQQNKSGKSIARKSKAPLHLRFHKANAALSSWTRSWMVAVAHRRSDGEDEAERDRGDQEELKAWRESWRMRYRGKPREDEEVSFSAVHRRVKGLVDRDHRLLETKWTLSWKMTNRCEDAK